MSRILAFTLALALATLVFVSLPASAVNAINNPPSFTYGVREALGRVRKGGK